MKDETIVSQDLWYSTFIKKDGAGNKTAEMSSRKSIGSTSILSSDLELDDEFFENNDDFHDPFRSPNSTLFKETSFPQIQISLPGNQSRDGLHDFKNYDCTNIVGHAIDLSNTDTSNSSNRRIVLELPMKADFCGMDDDDLSAAEFLEVTSTPMVGAVNHIDLDESMDNDDLSLAEFHLPSAEKLAPSHSMEIFGNQIISNSTSDDSIDNKSIGNNHFRGMATIVNTFS